MMGLITSIKSFIHKCYVKIDEGERHEREMRHGLEECEEDVWNKYVCERREREREREIKKERRSEEDREREREKDRGGEEEIKRKREKDKGGGWHAATN